MSDIPVEPVEVELSEEEYDWALIREAVQWCPEHHSKECSPIRNGCGKIDAQKQALARRYADE